MKTFIFYDITNNKIRKKIVSLLLDYSFQRIQFSVFLGEKLDSGKEKEFLIKIKKIISSKDIFYLFNINDKNFNKFYIYNNIKKRRENNSSFLIY